MIFQIILAGNDSSSSTIGSALKFLTEMPETQESLRKNPSRAQDFIDEVLRLESPFGGHFRIVKQDGVSLHGIPLPKGTRLMVLWASANRD
jgi:cytochrome P450 family 144